MTIKAPWTQDQVDSLNGFQECGYVHPFTCMTNSTPLIATKYGWVCECCDWKQDWAHEFMTNWKWQQCNPLLGPIIKK